MIKLKLARDCKVLNQTEDGIIVIEKGPGILTHPNLGNSHSAKRKRPCLLNYDYNHDGEFYEISESVKLYLTHRLDSPTSGIIITATRKNLAQEIKDKFKRKEIEKTYHAIVSVPGKIKPGQWNDHLEEKRVSGKLRVFPGKGILSKSICFVERNPTKINKLALIKLHPQTGRTHQLRVQTSCRKIPIVGDKTYGDFSMNRKIIKTTQVVRLCLHASAISFRIKNRRIAFESNLPREFEKLLTLP
tara:strand:- start:1001 stop:1735 length:735 start_codon:yes stop_codon:yes gene_type:complete